MGVVSLTPRPLYLQAQSYTESYPGSQLILTFIIVSTVIIIITESY
jgi:hypothetical protein